MALTNAKRAGMYLCEDKLIFEHHQDYTLVTNLFNRTLPLVRYRMDDILTREPESEQLLPYTRVREVVGRMEQAPVFLNRHGKEDFISPIVIVEFYARHLRRFQLRILGPASFLFRAVLEKGLSVTERNEVLLDVRTKLQEILRQKELDNVTFEVEETEALAVDAKTGKFKLIAHCQ